MPTPLLFFLAAFALCYGLHEAAKILFPRWGVLDKPEKYNLSRAPLPYPTGIVSVIVFVIVFAIARGELSLQDKGLITATIILALITFIDDVRGLPSWLRLLIQIVIGFVLFAVGTKIYTITNPLGGIIKLDTTEIQSSDLMPPLLVWSGVFTIVWIVLTTNAFNWFDGIPGQVSILSIIGALTLGFLAISDRVNQPEIALIAFILAGVAAGSALFDFPPNKVVMGDTGAMFFGLMLGTLSIYAGGKVATALLVLGVPLMDAVLVTLRRIAKKQSPFGGNLDHLHHRLLRKGWSEKQVIALTVALGSAFGITALFLSTFEKFVAIVVLGAVMLWLTWYSRSEKNAEKTIPPHSPPLW